MRWSARVSISRCTGRPFIDEIRLGRRPGTALAVGGSQRKLGPLTFSRFTAATPRPMVDRALIGSRCRGGQRGANSHARRSLAFVPRLHDECGHRTGPTEAPPMALSAGATDVRDRPLPVAGFIGTPEAIERHWYEEVYRGRGDSMAQLTWRAVLMGSCLGG